MNGLIDPADLAGRLELSNLRIFDTRFSLQNVDEGRELYSQEHIPGAIYADLEKDLSGEIIAGRTGRHPLPPLDDFIARLQHWGITESTQIVIYDEGSHAMASRLWWMLAVWLGHKHVSIVHGGLASWKDLGLPVTRLVPEYLPSTYAPVCDDTATVTTQDVFSSLGSLGVCLLDARGEARFRGEEEPIDTVAGHIPGAFCLPFAENLDGSSRFLDKDRLNDRFAFCQDKQVICYCGSGVTACHNIFAMYLVGMKMPKLYSGSWSEWILDHDLPVATGQ
ncbi:sulfurtransferase [Sansalvadorimonas sp. 2012CJ34-2]|uniref:Sulfurtransferase n=1 Tax=Parendozoicomonas callyspongiae TaxID=2942213 RepID=A0ABT0PFR8_9GAMM|nr:sulfurtransferase [Sansalvadorimonas sp. 2012CJ34-2]MCL6269602.1 sulfurtransferase [Sansalvadorimonas sp. 2012CJ34-2]